MLRQMLLLMFLASPALAEIPDVITDIVPIQSLAARVMQGLGSPEVILPPGASPHDYSFRPLDAQHLAQADLVIWMGPALTPWLTDPIATLAPDAARLDLLATTGWTALPLRMNPDYADGDEAPGIDPHAWLDPSNAAVFMTLIAQSLARIDPDHAADYAANATAAQGEMVRLQAATLARLAPLAGGTFIVPHDAYQYFETAFAIPAAGAISLTDASTPGPARIAALRDRVASGAITCVLTDPQTSPDWTEVLRDGNIARTAFVDPDGGSLAAQVGDLAGLYPAIITQIATGLAACLEGG